jgi:hypothetical protein
MVLEPFWDLLDNITLNFKGHRILEAAYIIVA